MTIARSPVTERGHMVGEAWCDPIDAIRFEIRLRWDALEHFENIANRHMSPLRDEVFFAVSLTDFRPEQA